ncbi:hypothetical protein SNE40_015470 [Patella caerulea]|uniref:Uncharacterized protein n=1 Tax=Patella caerulea TaxID=87958 RepID=A0AAN8JGZ9_PATCE
MHQRIILHILCGWLITRTSSATSTSPNTNDSAPTSPYALDCAIRPVDVSVRDEVVRLLETGVKMIEYDLKFNGYYDEMLNRKGGSNFKWSHWVRTMNSQARSLLMLNENYELLSLGAMRIGVELMEVAMYDEPDGCIGALSVQDTTALIRETLLYDFKEIDRTQPKPTKSLGTAEHVCNMYVRDDAGYASFVYNCCHYDPDGVLICKDIVRGVWMNILMIFTIVIKVMIILYSPLLVPGTLYRKKFTAAEYHYHVKDKKKLKVVATRFPESYESPNKNVKLGRVQGMEYFKTMLNTMKLDKVYEVELNDFRLSVSQHRLIRENCVPVGVFRYLYNNFCRCKIRFTDTLKPCCDKSICGNLNPGFGMVPWHKCLRTFMKLIQIVLLAVPWILRIVVYTNFEHDSITYKREVANAMGLKAPFEGSFTLHLTPFHGIFLVCYIVLALDSLVYGVVTEAVQEKFKMVLRDCLRDMKEKSKLGVCSWAMNLALVPFDTLGILGFLLVVPFWIILSPLFSVVFIFYFVPTINLTLRLLIQLFIFLCPDSFTMRFKIMKAKSQPMNEKLRLNKLGQEENFRKKDGLSKVDIVVQFFAIIVVIISFWSLTLLAMECISFFVEVGVYTLIGIIINAGVTVRYISVIFLLTFYVRDTFGKLYKKYLNFYKVITSHILEHEKDKITDTAQADAMSQENTVFRVECENNSKPDIYLMVRDGIIKWQTSGFLVFLDQEDTPYFSEKFFFEAIEMKYHGCPGPLYRNVFRTFVEFSKIILFLAFFIVVIMAFGDVYNISSTNQMLATVAGGLMPIVFRHVFANKGTDPNFNANSVQFQAEFNAALRRFQQSWPVYDIVPIRYRELHSRYSMAVDPNKEEFVDANDQSRDATDNNNDVTERIMMTSSTHSLDKNDNEVDLVVDVSNFSDRYRAKFATKAHNGSLSMLAESYRDPEAQKMIRSNVYEI